MSPVRCLARALGPIVLAALLGCGDGNPRTYPIPGRVTYDDGSPVPGATVIFQTTVDGKNVIARGRVESDGSFRLTTFRDNDGVVAGEHQIALSPLPMPDSGKPTRPAVASLYGDTTTSGLKATVAPDTKSLDLQIRRDPARR
jgi:hypothetical protein